MLGPQLGSVRKIEGRQLLQLLIGWQTLIFRRAMPLSRSARKRVVARIQRIDGGADER